MSNGVRLYLLVFAAMTSGLFGLLSMLISHTQANGRLALLALFLLFVASVWVACATACARMLTVNGGLGSLLSASAMSTLFLSVVLGQSLISLFSLPEGKVETSPQAAMAAAYAALVLSLLLGLLGIFFPKRWRCFRALDQQLE